MFKVGDRLEFNPSGPVYIDEKRHMFIAGGSGSGKSSFLSRLAIDAVRAGNSIVLIDPHATFADAVLEHTPKSRLRDVVIFDPMSEKPIGLPVLVHGDELSCDTFIKILAEQFGANSFMGRSYMIVRNFLYALVDAFEQPTAFHVWLMFMFDDYAKWVFSRCSSATLRQWAVKYFEKTPERQREEAASAPMNKEDALIALQKLRHIFAQPDGLDFFDAIQSRKIVVCVLRKGMLGDDATNLLGSVILRLTLSAVLKRDPAEKNPFLTVIVDEFHNFTKGTSPEAFFAETRKYGAAFITATQSGNQLDAGALDFILPNVSNVILFRLSGKDAK
jgi:DNA helicase HerA-like ATPase